MTAAYDAGAGNGYIPDYMMPGLRRYIDDGILPGRFLQGVLRNDFREAVTMADATNRRNLRAYAIYLYNEAPGACHGSSEKVDAWVAMKELDRRPPPAEVPGLTYEELTFDEAMGFPTSEGEQAQKDYLLQVQQARATAAESCAHQWNQTAGEADESGTGIRCLKCGQDGDA